MCIPNLDTEVMFEAGKIGKHKDESEFDKAQG